MSKIGEHMEYIEELKDLENKEKARNRAKEHYYKYKETHLKAQKKWKENNPEKVKEYEKKRYEKRKQLKQENERLNNIINEFNKWLLGEKMMFYKGSDGERLIRFNETTSKWLELKGSISNEQQ